MMLLWLVYEFMQAEQSHFIDKSERNFDVASSMLLAFDSTPKAPTAYYYVLNNL